MAPRKLLLDTNVIIDLFHGDPTIRRLIAISDGVYVPAVVIGELLGGAHRPARPAENVAEIEAFAANNRVLNCDLETARQYGEIYSQLRARGKLIPENDMWVAAVAQQHGLPLATRDAHFTEVHSVVRVPC
jgi:tRNA(fMet)-specific endonuclease VapC